MNIAKVILIASDVPVMATVIYAAVLRHKLSQPLRVFSAFIYLSGVIQFASLFLWFGHRNNLSLVHIYVPGSFLCLAWFYRAVLGDFIRPGIIWSVAILFVLFSIINTLFVQPISIFNSYALVAESILIVILSLFTFLFFLNHTIRETGIPDIKSLVWINSGLFIYYLSSLIIYYFSNNTMFFSTLALRRYPWVFHSLLSIVMYSCFLTGLWKRLKTPS